MAGGKLNAGVIEYAGANTPGWVSNLGIYEAGGAQLRIGDCKGSELNSANVGWVTVPSVTAGQLVTLKVSTSFSFNENLTTNFGFGVTEANNWAEDVPFFIYVINKADTDITGTDGNSTFAVSRKPNLTTSPSDGQYIGDSDAIATTDGQTSILILQSVTKNDYRSLPMQLVGAFRAQWASGVSQWDIQTIDDADGIGQSFVERTLSKQWVMPLAQNGAAADTHIHANGGTAPTFTNDVYYYYLRRGGDCRIAFNLNGDGGTAGVGAVQTRVSLPLSTLASESAVTWMLSQAGGGAAGQFVNTILGAGDTHFEMREVGGGASVENGDFTAGQRWIFGSLLYRIE